jgi:O-antigen/teichoic acid export membrane protein
MASKEKQIKNSFIYLLPVIVGNLIPILTLPIFTRILSKEDYGVLALALAYAIFATGLTNFGMTAAYDRNYFQYDGKHMESAQLLYSVVAFVIVNFLLFSCLTYLLKDTLSKLITGSNDNGSLLFWAFCGQFFNSVNYYYLSYFKNSENAKNYSAYAIAVALINFALSLLLVAYLRIGVIGIVYAQVGSGALIFCLLNYKFSTILPITINMRIFYQTFRIAYPLTPRVFLGVIGTQFDKYMIGLLASIGGVGIYSIGQRIATIVFSFMTAIHNVYQPQVMKRMFDQGPEGGESIGRYLTPYAYITILFAIMMSLFSEEMIIILIPQSYHSAMDVVTILSMYYGFLFFGTHSQLLFVKKTHLISLLSVVSISFNVLLNIPFILKWGFIGAAWATFLASMISGSIHFAVAQHFYEIKWEYKKIGAIFFIFFASAVLVILMRHFVVAYEFRLILKCASVFSYIYLGIRLKIVTMENCRIVRNMLSLRKANSAIHLH